jgi:uncharacterized protein (UPF0332 family)
VLKDKALENLAAGERLFEDGRFNAAASRYYYAAFQAAVVRFAALGRPPGTLQGGADRWNHALVAQNTWLLRGRREDARLYRGLMELRTQADYQDRAVNSSDLAPYRRATRDFVRELTP